MGKDHDGIQNPDNVTQGHFPAHTCLLPGYDFQRLGSSSHLHETPIGNPLSSFTGAEQDPLGPTKDISSICHGVVPASLGGLAGPSSPSP